MIPTFTTARLIIGPFCLEDVPAVQELAGNPAIARFTANIPHPYPDGAAEAWIASHEAAFAARSEIVFAIREPDGTVVGACGLTLCPEHERAELGYWIGVPWWGRGYCTEAAQRVIDYAFSEWPLHKICAHHLGQNPASGRVMEKLGMNKDGVLRAHMLKNDVFDDFVAWSILRSEWQLL